MNIGNVKAKSCPSGPKMPVYKWILRRIVLNSHFYRFHLSFSLLHLPHIFDVKMADIHKVYLSSLFLAYLFQFQNPALLSSPLLCLLIGSVLARYFQVELAAPSHQSSSE